MLDLLDRVYEAAVLPEHWPGVLHDLSGAADAAGAVLFTANAAGVEWWAASPATERVMRAFVGEGWMARNSRAFRQVALQHQGFATDLDLFTEDELEQDPLHAELLYPHGFGWAAGTVIQAPTGDLLIYNVERRREDGPFGADAVACLDRLRAPLARAALLTARLAQERARTAAEALGALGLAAAVLARRSARLLAANDLLQAMMPGVVVERRGPAGWRVGLANRAADALLQQALVGLTRVEKDAAAGSCSLPIPARGEAPPFIVHLLPVRRSARDMFADASCLLIVTPVVRGAVPSAEVVRGLFDLTAAEARVARWLAAGGTVEGLAESLGRSPETVRGQLRDIFAKTGMTRQSDLVALLSGLALPRRPLAGSSGPGTDELRGDLERQPVRGTRKRHRPA